VRSRLTVRMRRRGLLDSLVAPETVDAPERMYPDLGAYACPCEDEDSVNRRDSEHGSSVPSSGSDLFRCVDRTASSHGRQRFVLRSRLKILAGQKYFRVIHNAPCGKNLNEN
jgi:hypothetical protein